MLTMLDFGFYVAELAFDWHNVHGTDRIVPTKIAYRKQTTIESWETKEHKPGITQRMSDGKTVSIPEDKLLTTIASLSGGKIPTSQLPAIALVDVSTVASQAAQLALTAQEGDVAIRTDLNKSYVHNGGSGLLHE